MNIMPDYAGLVSLLFTLKRFPDGLGETVLTHEEATKIAALGFAAAPGRWRVPPLPPHLTRGNALLEPLSVGWHDPPITAIRASESVWERPRLESTEESGEITALKSSTEILGGCPNEVECPAPRAVSPTDQTRIRELVGKMRDRASRLTKPMPKRRWQQLYWRYPARIFNLGFQIMLREKSISLEIR